MKKNKHMIVGASDVVDTYVILDTTQYVCHCTYIKTIHHSMCVYLILLHTIVGAHQNISDVDDTYVLFDIILCLSLESSIDVCVCNLIIVMEEISNKHIVVIVQCNIRYLTDPTLQPRQ
jgi:hypothetical protein